MFLISITGLYVILLLWLLIRFLTIPASGIAAPEPEKTVTVIIPARNEEQSLPELLEDIEAQNYPEKLLEVIVINDASEDNTRSVVCNFSGRINVNLIDIKAGEKKYPGKKSLITKAVHASSGHIIITTDADCRAGRDWVRTIAGAFAGTEIKIVSGPVACHSGKRMFQRFQALELAALIGTGASTLAAGMPTMCNGANLAFRKDAFISVGGYTGNEHVASGDDEFLLHKISSRYPRQACFLKQREAIVNTSPTRQNHFADQRKRWAGKWFRYSSPFPVILAVFIFLLNASLLAGFVLVLMGELRLFLFLSILGVKILAEAAFVWPVSVFLYNRFFPLSFLIGGLIYPLYAFYFGIAATLGSYSWKGRKKADHE